MVARLFGRAVCFFFLLPWMPAPLQILLFPFVPSLSAGVYYCMGPRWGLLTLGFTLGLAYFLLGGADTGWIWLIQWVAMGPIFVVAMSRAKTLERAMLFALLATLGLQVLLLFVKSIQLQIPPWTVVEKNIDASIQRALGVYREMGLFPEEMTLAQGSISSIARAMALIAPGSIIAVDLLFYWWTLLVQRWILGLSAIQGLGPKVLRTWGLSYPWVWLTIVGGILTMLPVNGLRWVGINLLIIMGTLHFLQGLGVVSAFFHHRDVPAFMRGIFYIFVCFQQVFLLGVIILGLFDIWFDFRRRWMLKSTDH